MVDRLSELALSPRNVGSHLHRFHHFALDGDAAGSQYPGYPPADSPAMHVKAVTYHQLLIQANADGWTAQIYFDI